MSFILDALKKSESERHRHSGPVLMDVRIAAPRRRLPVWAWVIAIVLAVNLLVLVWLLWLAPERARTAQAPAAQPAAAAPAPAAAPPSSTGAAATPPSTGLPDPALAAAAATLQSAPPLTQNPVPVAPAAVPNISSLPRYQDLVGSGMALPTLQLNLHVHDAQPGNRFVLLNGTRLREGEFTQEGLKVVQIVPTGVVLEWRAQQFFLNAGG